MRTISSLCKSLYLLALIVSSLLYFFIILLSKIFWKNITSRNYSKQKIAQKIARHWAKSIFHSTPGWSIEILPHNVDLTKAYVIVANHQSATDILALYYLNTNFSWLSKSAHRLRAWSRSSSRGRDLVSSSILSTGSFAFTTGIQLTSN